MATPLSAAVLKEYLTEFRISQQELGDKIKLDRAVISYNVTQKREIKGDHIPNYLQGLPTKTAAAFLAAWIRDTTPKDIADALTDSPETLSETFRQWSPSLTAEQQAQLSWLATEMCTDPELAEVVSSLIKRLGYASKTHTPTAPPLP